MSGSMVELAWYTSKHQVQRAFEFSPPPSLVTCPAGSFQRKASYSQATCFPRERGLLVATIIVQKGKRWVVFLKTGFAALFHPGEDEPPLEIVEWCEEGAFGPHCVKGLRHLYVLICHWTLPACWDEFLTGTSPKYTNPSEIRFLTLSKMKHHPIGSGCWLQESTGRNLQQCILNGCIINFVLVTSIYYMYIYIHIKL